MTTMLQRNAFSMRFGCVSAALYILAGTHPAFAQTDLARPFDMSPETGSRPQAVDQAPVPPVSAPPVSANMPQIAPSATAIRQPWRRYLIPADILSIIGEEYQHSWNIILTAEEAKAPAQLNLGYQNAILVAPESSYIVISINNVEIIRQTVRSSDQISALMMNVPDGLLRAGNNKVSIRAQQRHRTDCTISSTYELWTNIDPAQTYLAFDMASTATGIQNKVARFTGSEDIAAIGVNAKGATQFNIIAPALRQNDNGATLLGLSQALAILAGMPNQNFAVERALDPALVHADGAHSGEMTVLVGTAAELSSVLDILQVADTASDMSNSSMRFIANGKTGEQFLLISGANWREIERNISSLVAMTERPANVMRDTLHTQNWNLPDAHILRSATKLSFADLGIATQQFSGRRLRTQFTFAVPADFYANSYGTASILLDAAYSPEVLPGSQIDIYVNGDIATTVPITNTGGGVMNQLPIRVEMRHFRPGLNTVMVEVALLTAADKACTTGTASSQTPRFALFDTSQFSMPDFGRIGQIPNLAALAGMAYPITYTQEPLPLSANLNDYNVLSASATLMGNLAVAAGRPLQIQHVKAGDELRTGNALFIGAITNLPDMVLMQAGINPGAKSIWSDDDVAPQVQENTNYTLSQWQEQLQPGWYARLQNFYTGTLKAFNITDVLQLFPGSETQFMPSKEISVLAAQGASPQSTGAWTVVTAPDTLMLRQGVDRLTQQTNWTKIDGRMSAYNREKQSVETLPVQKIEFVATQPLSFNNIRLIATNWLSSNALSYIAIVLACLVALGLSTSLLLSRFGRRDDAE